MDEAEEAFLNQAIAYHEAGHAVVATARGRRVKLVTIIPQGELLGRCELEECAPCIDTAWGGPVGQAICSGYRDLPLTHAYCEHDRRTALEYAANDAELVGERLTAVRALLAEPRYYRQLCEVADALLEAQTLTGDRLREMITEPSR